MTNHGIISGNPNPRSTDPLVYNMLADGNGGYHMEEARVLIPGVSTLAPDLPLFRGHLAEEEEGNGVVARIISRHMVAASTQEINPAYITETLPDMVAPKKIKIPICGAICIGNCELSRNLLASALYRRMTSDETIDENLSAILMLSLHSNMTGATIGRVASLVHRLSFQCTVREVTLVHLLCTGVLELIAGEIRCNLAYRAEYGVVPKPTTQEVSSLNAALAWLKRSAFGGVTRTDVEQRIADAHAAGGSIPLPANEMEADAIILPTAYPQAPPEPPAVDPDADARAEEAALHREIRSNIPWLARYSHEIADRDDVWVVECYDVLSALEMVLGPTNINGAFLESTITGGVIGTDVHKIQNLICYFTAIMAEAKPVSDPGNYTLYIDRRLASLYGAVHADAPKAEGGKLALQAPDDIIYISPTPQFAKTVKVLSNVTGDFRRDILESLKLYISVGGLNEKLARVTLSALHGAGMLPLTFAMGYAYKLYPHIMADRDVQPELRRIAKFLTSVPLELQPYAKYINHKLVQLVSWQSILVSATVGLSIANTQVTTFKNISAPLEKGKTNQVIPRLLFAIVGEVDKKYVSDKNVKDLTGSMSAYAQQCREHHSLDRTNIPTRT
eukprot:GHVR01186497.1.p1 GENE.GHVR01186497.1~~GHVR01186497.1.p1  ORF type:complete len:619 (+),score=49.74 GHVR01186497.1:308-2164(+)